MNPPIQLKKAAPVFLVAVVCFRLFADNASGQTPTPTATPTPTPTPIATGFVIGDLDAVVGNHVTFWGAQWSRLNHLSGGPAPASFKGFANSPDPNPPACAGTWQSGPGNSSGPPESVPADIIVIVSSLITKSGPIISGDVPEMVIVHTDPGYEPNPGHAGTGTVTAVVCQSALLGNISTRGFVQTGNNVMIAGFIIEGTGPKRVLVRAIGPELTPYGVPDVLADPTLELHNGTGALIASNDNWQHTIIGGIITAGQVGAIQNSGHAPTAPSESAIIATLQPGNYTAIVRGVNDTTGVALAEVYDLQ